MTPNHGFFKVLKVIEAKNKLFFLAKKHFSCKDENKIICIFRKRSKNLSEL